MNVEVRITMVLIVKIPHNSVIGVKNIMIQPDVYILINLRIQYSRNYLIIKNMTLTTFRNIRK